MSNNNSLLLNIVGNVFDYTEELMDGLDADEARGAVGPCAAGIRAFNLAAIAATNAFLSGAPRAEKLTAVRALRAARAAAYRDSSRLNDSLLAGLTVWGTYRAPDTDAFGRSSAEFRAPVY